MINNILITPAQKNKLWYEALFCAVYKADLSQAPSVKRDGMNYYADELRQHLPSWFESNTIPIELKRYLIEHWAMHQACLWLSEAGFDKPIFRNNMINSLTVQEADYLIKRFLELKIKIQRGLGINRFAANKIKNSLPKPRHKFNYSNNI